MKKTFLTVLLFYIFTGIAVAQNLSKTTEYKILLTGASFASPQNGWFEIGCRKLNAEAINRAIGGEAIANTANRMANGTLYSKEELENIDALVIMQVHNKDVYEELQLKDKYTDYEVPFDRITRQPMIMSSNVTSRNAMNYVTILHPNTIILLMVNLQLLYYVHTGMIVAPFTMKVSENSPLNGDFL